MSDKDKTLEANANAESDVQEQLAAYERTIRKLNREISHLKNAISQEKTAYTTVLNQQKASTYIQRQRERYLALLLANSPSIILFLSQTERVEFCTEYFVAKANFNSVADVLGRSLTEVLSPFLGADSRERLLEQSESAIKSGAPVSLDVTFRFNKDSIDEDFVGLLVPMMDGQQQSNGIMLMFHDVTDLKRSREEALEASRAKSAFLSNMSHEIRTPMNAIIGMTSIGKKEKNLERKDYAFNKIESASTHLLGVINDILDISKIESGKMELSQIDFSFSQMIERVKSVVVVKMQDKQQHFTVEIDSAIPDTLFGDDQHLAQIITNFLSNATKFTHENGFIEFNAKLVSLRSDRCTIQMYVKDSGIGMSQEEQSKLFNIFQQAEAGTARKYGGSGLGLAISKRMLELMDGRVWLESETGKGSCFFFTVDLGVPAQSNPADGIASSGELSDLDGDFTGKTIMIVDDMEINLEIAISLLEPTNVTVETANSGKDAVKMFAANPDKFDLILMDMQMPEIDGIAATKMIRALGIPKAASIPIIAMTANVFKEDIQKCTDAGMNGHLGKPMDIKNVIKTIFLFLKARNK